MKKRARSACKLNNHTELFLKPSITLQYAAQVVHVYFLFHPWEY